MVIGFVLINITPGMEEKVFNTIQKWKDTQELYSLFGDYDLIVKIQALNYDILSDIIIHKIRTIKGVIETKTLPIAKF